MRSKDEKRFLRLVAGVCLATFILSSCQAESKPPGEEGAPGRPTEEVSLTESGALPAQKEDFFGIKYYQYNCPIDFPDDETVIAWSDEMLNGKLYVQQDMTEPLPYQLKDFDWNVQFTSAPNTYQLYLQALNPVAFLAKGYMLTQKAEYLELAEKLLESWEGYLDSSGKTENNPFVWYDHGTALRAENIIYYALVCEWAGRMDERKEKQLRSLLERHAEFLSEEKNYTKNHNHGIYQDRAMVYLAYFLDDEKTEERLELAKTRLEAQKQHAFNVEMVHVENSPGYQYGVMKLFQDISDFLSQFDGEDGRLNIDLSPSAEFMAWIMKPDKVMAEIGDTNSLSSDTMDMGIFKNPHLDYATSQGAAGEKPEEYSGYYPQSGYFFSRESWEKEEFNQSTWTMFKSGYSSRTHKHADDLSFMLYSKGYDIFVDPGWYNYMTGNIYRDYLVSSKAHNTVIVDGKSYSATEENSGKVGLLEGQEEEGYDYALGYNEMYAGVGIDRHFYRIGDAVVLIDDIDSQESHEYSQLFQLSEYMEVVETSDKEVLLQLGETGYRVRIRQLGEGTELEVLHGEPDKEYGHVSRQLNHITESVTLKFDLSGSNARYITAITIEDENGKLNFTKTAERPAELDTYTAIRYDAQVSALRVRDREIPLNLRTRFEVDNIQVDAEEDAVHLVNLCRQEGLSYAWYLIDRESGQAIYKGEYSDSPEFTYRFHEPGEYLVRAYVKLKDGQRKSAMAAALRVSGEKGGMQRVSDISDEYPFLNLIYNGHEMTRLGGSKYLFKVNFDYSLDYSVRWYVYRNGGYYQSMVTDNDTLEYEFQEPGDYTVMYYLRTRNGENEYWNFGQITVE